MTDELRAAAELWREWCAKQDDAHADWRWGRAGAAMAAAMRLADAYLAEHPADDGEPVTEEWLRSIGFVRGPHEYDLDRPIVPEDGGLDYAVRLHLWDGDHAAFVVQDDGVEQHDSVLLSGLPCVLSRGHVRRLLVALEVTP